MIAGRQICLKTDVLNMEQDSCALERDFRFYERRNRNEYFSLEDKGHIRTVEM
jgi:hypothetical protein